MDNRQYFIYLMIMAISTYLIRTIPFVAVKEKIKSTFINSFLYYIPYAVLSAMTIPAIFYAPSSMIAAVVAVVMAVIFALKNKSLMTVAVIACLTVFVIESILMLI
ncbi:MAG: AzlD domain-containing protein [Bacteroidaceae bacterium]|nr:AzlD domain-containing protein [Bacteroidaceae bacterium]